MLKTFRTYQLAVELHQKCRRVPLPYYLKDQLLRAASSICLNLAEGSVKPTRKDRMRFYSIAFASLREVQAIADLEPNRFTVMADLMDHVGACLYRLVHS